MSLILISCHASFTAPEICRAADPPALTDIYGDPLPPGATTRLGTVRWRARHEIAGIEFVPGDKYLATTDGRVLNLWDPDTGRMVRTISIDDSPEGRGFDSGVDFSSDGKRLLSIDADSPFGDIVHATKSRLLLWDFSSGKIIAETSGKGLLFNLAIARDGRVAACANPRGDVYLWNPETNEMRQIVRGDGRASVTRASFIGGGKQFVLLLGEARACRRFDVASGKLLSKFELGQCNSFALATGTGTVATYCDPDKLSLYDPATGVKRDLPLKGKVDSLELFFSPDGGTLLAMDHHAESVQFWDAAKGQLLRQVHFPGMARLSRVMSPLILSGDGKRLVSVENERVVRVWDARTGQAVLRFPGHVIAPVQLAFSASSKEIRSYAPREDRFGGQLYYWDLATAKLLRCVSLRAPAEGAADIIDWRFAPGNRHIAGRVDGTTDLFDAVTGKCIVLADNAPPKSDWNFSPDGRALVTLGVDQKLRLWDVTTGKLQRQLELEKKRGPISWFRFTPDGRTLATGEDWQKLHLWDAVTGKHRLTITLPVNRNPSEKPLDPWETSFTPDGRYLFTSSRTNLWIWDLVARREIGPFEKDEHEFERINVLDSGPVAVSPDGRLMAWFDPALKLRLYEISTGKIIHRFTDDYSSIVFAPSGWRLATGCDADASVLIWDLPLLFRSQPLLSKDASPEGLWTLLKSDDAVQAHRALWRLVDLPAADAFLAIHLQPVEVVPPERLRALLNDLGSPEFETREKAEQALAAAREPVRPDLAKAIGETKDAEVRRRLEGLLDRLKPRAPERLREVRAVMVLEARGTIEARRLLRRLAGGAPDASLTLLAKDALQRLPK
jgi:WD40 repeat protein